VLLAVPLEVGVVPPPLNVGVRICDVGAAGGGLNVGDLTGDVCMSEVMLPSEARAYGMDFNPPKAVKKQHNKDTKVRLENIKKLNSFK
jgi:hypothetical protein